MTGAILLLLLLMGFSGDSFHAAPASPSPPPPPPPPKPPSPSPHGGTYTPPAAAKAKAKTVPVSWPQATPKDLPPFPGGWEPDNPPAAAVTARAWQLLPTLWKKGKGALTVEKVADHWVTFQAFVPSAGKKGVAAFRVKPGAMPAGGSSA